MSNNKPKRKGGPGRKPLPAGERKEAALVYLKKWMIDILGGRRGAGEIAAPFLEKEAEKRKAEMEAAKRKDEQGVITLPSSS